MKKTPSSGKSLISTYSILGVVANLSLSGSGRKVWWGGRLFEAGRLLPFSAFRMGAYSRWALNRGWALIRINTVYEQEPHERNLDRAVIKSCGPGTSPG